MPKALTFSDQPSASFIVRRPFSFAFIFVAVGVILVIASVVLWALEGFWFLAITVSILASVLGTTLTTPTLTLPKIGAFFATGLASAYTMLAAIGELEGFVLLSDSYVYDQVARVIASTVPLHVQLNPVRFDYVFEAGIEWGAIAQPGFYKLMGILYSLGESVDVRELHIQIPAAVNIVSYTAISYALLKLLGDVGISPASRCLLWWLFITLPYFLEQLLWLRKDTLLLAVSLITLVAAKEKVRWPLVALLLYVVGTVRLAQAVWLALIWVALRWNVLSWPIAKAIPANAAIVLVLVGIPAVVSLYHPMEMSLARESIEALLRDRLAASVGFSAMLEKSAVGAALYGVLYPLPNVAPRDWAAIVSTAYAYLYWGLLGLVIFKARSIVRADRFAGVLWWGLVLMVAGFAFMAVVSWKNLGFVIAESRFKLLLHAVLIVLGAYYFGGRRRRRDVRV